MAERHALALGALAQALLVDGEHVGGEGHGAGVEDAQGAVDIARIGCGTCHIIPGIDGARGLVGPPLDHMGRRVYIAGLLRNTPRNMVTWLRYPQRIVPGYAMPERLDLGFNYYQEFAPEDEAVDEGETFAILDSLEVGGITYRDVLQVLETTEVEQLDLAGMP